MLNKGMRLVKDWPDKDKEKDNDQTYEDQDNDTGGTYTNKDNFLQDFNLALNESF